MKDVDATRKENDIKKYNNIKKLIVKIK